MVAGLGRKRLDWDVREVWVLVEGAGAVALWEGRFEIDWFDGLVCFGR